MEEKDYEDMRMDERKEFRHSKETSEQMDWILKNTDDLFEDESHVIRSAITRMFTQLKKEATNNGDNQTMGSVGIK